jgi:hypothetical protein
MIGGVKSFTLCFLLPVGVFASNATSSVNIDMTRDCSVSAAGPSQIKTCAGPAGYQAVIYQTPMGEQLTLENAGAAFSAAVVRCKAGQQIKKLAWRKRGDKPFAALIGYRCATSVRGQSAQGSELRILVQGLKGFEEYGHEVRNQPGGPTIKAAEALADGWLNKK